jgi:hypothetical protein
LFERLINTAEIPQVKVNAQYNLALICTYGEAADKQKVRALLEYLTTQTTLLGAKEVADVYAALAIEYFSNSAQQEKKPEQAFEYAQKALQHPEYKSLPMYMQVKIYFIAGVLSYEGTKQHEPNYAQAQIWLEQAEQHAKQAGDVCMVGRAQYVLGKLFFFYFDPMRSEDRYRSAWTHFTKALGSTCQKESCCQKNKSFINAYLAEMSYFGIGCDADIKKADEYIEQYKKLNSNKELPDCIKLILHHKGYCAPLTPKKVGVACTDKQTHAKEIERLLESKATGVAYMACALLGEILAKDAQGFSEQAALRATSDPGESLALLERAQALRTQATTLLERCVALLPSYPKSLANMTLGRMALTGPAKNYEKAYALFKAVVKDSTFIPQLRAAATYEMAKIDEQRERTHTSPCGTIGLVSLFDSSRREKDSHYSDAAFASAQARFAHNVACYGDCDGDCFGEKCIFASVLSDCQKAQQSKNALLKMRIKGFIEYVEAQRTLVARGETALQESDFKQAHDCFTQLTSSRSKALQNYAQKQLNSIKEHMSKDKHASSSAQSMSLSLDSSLDAPAAMDEHSDPERRSKKRKAGESPLVEIPAAKKSEGAGSGPSRVLKS